MITIKQILKAIDCPHLQLYKGEGYYYFVYSNEDKHIWEDESVYTFRLNHMSLEKWVEYGKAFVKETENKEEE